MQKANWVSPNVFKHVISQFSFLLKDFYNIILHLLGNHTMDFKPIFGYLEWQHQTEISFLIIKNKIKNGYESIYGFYVY